MMRAIVFLLYGTAALRFLDGALHGVCDVIRVHDDMSIGVARRAADDLDQRSIRAQEPLFIGIEDGDERYFRHIQSLSEQIDANEYIEFPRAQIMNDFRAFDGRDIRVEVAHLDADLFQIVGEVFRHAFRECCHEYALLPLDAFFDFPEEVVNLSLERTYLDFRVEQSRRADDLLRNLLGMSEFILSRRCRDEDDLVDARCEFLKGKRAIIKGRRQTKTVFDK